MKIIYKDGHVDECPQDQELHVIRHTAAHVMAQAIKRLYPEADFAFGPATENGFYYDVDLGDTKLTDEDLANIEKEMRKITKENLAIKPFILPRAEAVKLMEERHENYKVEHMADLADETEFSFFQQGEYVDMCIGPHLTYTKALKAFKITQQSGAYWKNDKENKMLTRINGVAFHNQEELDSYPHFDTTTVGDFRFVDANGNGILEKDADRVIVGNYMPDFYYGFSVNLSWKGFDLAANFQGVYGNEILNLERRYLLNMEASSNMMKESLQRYPYGELNRATRKSSGNNGACTSTFHLEDGSYLRLQNLSLGYTFPDKWTRKAGISKLRIYVQGTNLFTWTDYTGYNPEVNKRSTDALRPGEDYCSYPLSRTFSVGVNFNL